MATVHPLFGYMWAYVRVNVRNNTPTLVQLKGTIDNTTLTIVRNHTRYNNSDSLSSQGVVAIDNTAIGSLDNAYNITSSIVDWIMIPLAGLSDIVFTVVAATSTRNLYDVIKINEGSGWNATAQAFIAPRSGIFVIAAQTAVACDDPQLHLDILLNNGNISNFFTMQFGFTSYLGCTDVESVGGAVLMNLTKGDVVMVSHQTKMVGNPQLTFVTGFHYNPPWEVSAVNNCRHIYI